MHTVSRLRLSGSGQYRIEPVPASGPGRPRRAETVICDGERRWRIGEDRAIAGPASPPLEIPNLFDASWLLGHRLTGGAEIVTGGRRGYRLTGASPGRPGGGWLMFPWLMFPDEVVVDAEFGILLRWIFLAGDRPVMRYELRDIAIESFDPGVFRPDIPPGTRVVEETDERPEGTARPVRPVDVAGVVLRQAAKDARSALDSVLDALRGR